MKKIITAVVFILPAILSLAQSGDITIKKGLGTRFESDGRMLKPKEVLKIMEPVPEAYTVFKKAKSNYDAAGVLGFIGGFMIGLPLGTALGGGDPQWGLAGGGAALVLISIPMSVAFNKHAKTAVDIYNEKSLARGRIKPSFHVNVYGTGAKLSVRF